MISSEKPISSPATQKDKPSSGTDPIESIGKRDWRTIKTGDTYLKGEVLVNTTYGLRDNQLGLQTYGQPLGPADIIVAEDSQVYLLDSLNGRVMTIDDKKGLCPVFSYSDKTNFQALAKTKDDNFLLLDNEKHKLLVYTPEGELSREIGLVFSKQDYINFLYINEQGGIFAIGQFYHKLIDDSTWEDVPGFPFYRGNHYVKPAKLGDDRFKISIFDGHKLSSEFEIKDAPFTAIRHVFTDKGDNIYVVFFNLKESKTPDKDGVRRPLINQMIIDIFNFHGQRLNTIPLNREEYAEHERELFIGTNGSLVRFVSSEQRIMVLKHQLEKKGTIFAKPNTDG